MTTHDEVDLQAVREAVLPAILRDHRRSRRRARYARALGGLAALALIANVALPASHGAITSPAGPGQAVASLQFDAFQQWQGGDAGNWLCAPATATAC